MAFSTSIYDGRAAVDCLQWLTRYQQATMALFRLSFNKAKSPDGVPRQCTGVLPLCHGTNTGKIP